MIELAFVLLRAREGRLERDRWIRVDTIVSLEQLPPVSTEMPGGSRLWLLSGHTVVVIEDAAEVMEKVSEVVNKINGGFDWTADKGAS